MSNCVHMVPTLSRQLLKIVPWCDLVFVAHPPGDSAMLLLLELKIPLAGSPKTKLLLLICQSKIQHIYSLDPSIHTCQYE